MGGGVGGRESGAMAGGGTCTVSRPQKTTWAVRSVRWSGRMGRKQKTQSMVTAPGLPTVWRAHETAADFIHGEGFGAEDGAALRLRGMKILRTLREAGRRWRGVGARFPPHGGAAGEPSGVGMGGGG